MPDAIFLSASVPDPKRSRKFAETADSVAITAAVSALVYVTLGRRMLVWGGHPAITPMIWVVAQDLGVNYARWVKLYQSNFFEDEFPEENARFQNVVFTENADNLDNSLILMRERMFQENEFSAAVFIGGMEGIILEYDLFRAIRPAATVLPIASTGGASAELPLPANAPELSTELDYVNLFHRLLNISVRERRYETPEEQPQSIEQRLWQAGEPR